MSQSSSDDPYVRVVFEAEIPLDRDDLDAGMGSMAQAIQNVIGHTGAVVIEADESLLLSRDSSSRDQT